MNAPAYHFTRCPTAGHAGINIAHGPCYRCGARTGGAGTDNPEGRDMTPEPAKNEQPSTDGGDVEPGTLRIKVGDREWSAPMTVDQLEQAGRRLKAVADPSEEEAARREQVKLLKDKTPAFDCRIDFVSQHFGSDFYPVPSAQVFEDNEGQPLDFIPGADIEAMAAHVFRKHEDLFRHILNFRLQFRWRAKGGQRQGAPTLGRCQKTAGLLREFSGADFVIMLSADHCRTYQLTFAQIEALVFHELCHVDATDAYKPRIEGHDFEGFVAELLHYGAWKNDLKAMEAAIVQPTLFDQAEGDGDGL